MKLYKIGQPWQNEPLIENKTEFIDNKQARFACQERKISNPKPRNREGCPILSNFSFGGDREDEGDRGDKEGYWLGRQEPLDLGANAFSGKLCR